MRVTDHRTIDPYWLAQRLLYVWQQGIFRALCRRHVNQASVSLERLKDLVLPLPRLPEQRAIARVLRTVQRAREQTEAVIAATRQLKASLLRHIFTYSPVPIDQAAQVPLKETEIGPIPGHWVTARLGQVAQAQSGGTPSRSRSDYFGGGIKWVKTLDLTNGPVAQTEETLTDAGLMSIRGKVRPANTVMVAMYGGAGTIGKCGILQHPAATNQAVCCLETDKQRLDPSYLLYYLILIRPLWMSFAFSTRKDPNISKGIVERKEIPLPPR